MQRVKFVNSFNSLLRRLRPYYRFVVIIHVRIVSRLSPIFVS